MNLHGQPNMLFCMIISYTYENALKARILNFMNTNNYKINVKTYFPLQPFGSKFQAFEISI